MDIPVFHNDQHGTAVVVMAGLKNALLIKQKKLEESKIVINGAGAAGIAIFKLLVHAGAKFENIYICDTKGVIYEGRGLGMTTYKNEVASQNVDKDTPLDEICIGADVLIGVSSGGQFTKKTLKKMNEGPIIFALSNPEPEILPQQAKEFRPDCMIATSLPEWSNQINNVICFPFLFRAVLDTMCTEINNEMLMAAANAIAAIPIEEVPDSVLKACPDRHFTFGPHYFVPFALDPRLLERVACAVAEAAQETKVAKQPIKNINEYRGFL